MNHSKYVNFCMETDHKHIYKSYMNYFYMLTITNMATLQIFEVISVKFSIESVLVKRVHRNEILNGIIIIVLC
jgi:hypothetical protein